MASNRSLLDRLLGIPGLDDFRANVESRNARGFRLADPSRTRPFDATQPLSALLFEDLLAPKPRNLVEQDMGLDNSRSTAEAERKEARKGARGDALGSFLQQLPYLMQALTADNSQQLHSSLTGSAEANERIAVLRQRREEQERERAFELEKIGRNETFQRGLFDDEQKVQARREATDMELFNVGLQREDQTAIDALWQREDDNRIRADERKADRIHDLSSRITQGKINRQDIAAQANATVAARKAEEDARILEERLTGIGMAAGIPGVDSGELARVAELVRQDPDNIYGRHWANLGRVAFEGAMAEGRQTTLDFTNVASQALAAIDPLMASPKELEIRKALQGQILGAIDGLGNAPPVLPDAMAGSDGFHPYPRKDELKDGSAKAGPSIPLSQDPIGQQKKADELSAALLVRGGSNAIFQEFARILSEKGLVGEPLADESTLRAIVDKMQVKNPADKIVLLKMVQKAKEQAMQQEMLEEAARERQERTNRRLMEEIINFGGLPGHMRPGAGGF